MQHKTHILKKFYITAATCGILVAAAANFAGAGQSRGNSGLPAGPGNPLASLQKQINDLDHRLDAVEATANEAALMWINHFDLLPGDASVVTTFNSTTSGVGSGLTGLVIQSTTMGEVDLSGGNKVVHKALQVPPNYTVKGMRVCYQSTSAASFISQIRLAQVENPPSSALVLLDDATDLVSPGPVCVDSAATSIDPSLGSLLFSLRVNFGNIADKIVLRGVGVYLQRNGL